MSIGIDHDEQLTPCTEASAIQRMNVCVNGVNVEYSALSGQKPRKALYKHSPFNLRLLRYDWIIGVCGRGLVNIQQGFLSGQQSKNQKVFSLQASKSSHLTSCNIWYFLLINGAHTNHISNLSFVNFLSIN